MTVSQKNECSSPCSRRYKRRWCVVIDRKLSSCHTRGTVIWLFRGHQSGAAIQPRSRACRGKGNTLNTIWSKRLLTSHQPSAEPCLRKQREKLISLLSQSVDAQKEGHSTWRKRWLTASITVTGKGGGGVGRITQGELRIAPGSRCGKL